MLVLKVRFGYTKFMLINIYRCLAETLHVISFKMTGTSSTEDAKVKVPSFQKVTFFLQYEIFHRDAIHLYFCLCFYF